MSRDRPLDKSDHLLRLTGVARPARWPIGRAALAALIDLSMSDETIARYFGVTAKDVADVRRQYSLNEAGRDYLRTGPGHGVWHRGRD